MKTIWKFPLEAKDYQVIEMPIDAEILSLQTQNETPCIWALVNDAHNKESRHFEMFGTGHSVPVDIGVERRFVGTFQVHGGALVFHIFERLN